MSWSFVSLASFLLATKWAALLQLRDILLKLKGLSNHELKPWKPWPSKVIHSSFDFLFLGIWS